MSDDEAIVMIRLTHADDGTGRYLDQGWRTMLDARRIESIEELKPAEQVAGLVGKVADHIRLCTEGHRGLSFDRADLHGHLAERAAEAALEVLHGGGVLRTVSYVTMRSGQAHTVVESIDEIGELMSLALNPRIVGPNVTNVNDGAAEEDRRDDDETDEAHPVVDAMRMGFADAAEYFNRMSTADPNNPETQQAMRESAAKG